MSNKILYSTKFLTHRSLNNNDDIALINLCIQTTKKLNNKAEYVGNYCLVEWLDDNALANSSLIHEWD